MTGEFKRLHVGEEGYREAVADLATHPENAGRKYNDAIAAYMQRNGLRLAVDEYGDAVVVVTDDVDYRSFTIRMLRGNSQSKVGKRLYKEMSAVVNAL